MPSLLYTSSRALVIKNRKYLRIKHSVLLSMKPPRQTHLMVLAEAIIVHLQILSNHSLGTYGRVIGAKSLFCLNWVCLCVCLFVPQNFLLSPCLHLSLITCWWVWLFASETSALDEVVVTDIATSSNILLLVEGNLWTTHAYKLLSGI